MEIRKFLKWLEITQKELTDALKLECNDNDVKSIEDKEILALYLETYLFLKKRKKYTIKLIKLMKKYFKYEF